MLTPSKAFLTALSLPSLFALGCSSNIGDGQMLQTAADAGPDDVDPADAAPPVISLDAGPQIANLQAGASNLIEADNSVSCNSNSPDFFHAENKYFRTYSLPDLGITTDLIVSNVDVGIQEATSLGGTQPIRVSLHTLLGEFKLENLTLLGEVNVDVADQVGQILPVPFDNIVVPAGSILVAEVFTPDGQINSNRFFIGSNKATEATPSYIVAPSGNCAIDEPTAMGTLGIPDLLMAVVLNVTGEHSSE